MDVGPKPDDADSTEMDEWLARKEAAIKESHKKCIDTRWPTVMALCAVFVSKTYGVSIELPCGWCAKQLPDPTMVPPVDEVMQALTEHGFDYQVRRACFVVCRIDATSRLLGDCVFHVLRSVEFTRSKSVELEHRRERPG